MTVIASWSGEFTTFIILHSITIAHIVYTYSYLPCSFTHDIEAVSCDEMFVDLTELLQSCKVSPEDFTTYLRERVQVTC